MGIQIFVAIVVFVAIWTVMAGLGLRAVFRLVSWLEQQTLSSAPKTYYKESLESPHEPIARRETRTDNPDEERALQEEVAFKTAQNRSIDYGDVESNLGALGEEIEDGDNSLDVVEKLRKMQDGK